MEIDKHIITLLYNQAVLPHMAVEEVNWLITSLSLVGNVLQ